MKPVVRFTLAHKVFFNLVFVLLMVAGAYSLLSLPVERFPLVNFGKVFITTYYRGASPEDVEALVTTEVEEAVEDMEDVEFIQSSSYREYSSVVVKFIDDTDYDDLYKELRFRVLNMQDELPEGADPPEFNKITTSDWLPVISVNLAGQQGNRALTLMAEEMKIPLSRIPGVKEVKLQGEFEREFHVVLDPEKMTALGVTFEDAARALQGANVSIPAGDFTDESGEFVVVMDERFRSRQEVIETVVRRDADGSFTTLGDIVEDAVLDYRDPQVISSVNGVPCVTLQILKTDEGNALDIGREVRAVVADFEPSMSELGVDLVLTQDSTVYIDEAMNTLGANMLLGIVLVCLIIWYFMGARNAALTTVGIPFAFLVTMIFMHYTGNSLNEITLFSFVLVSGIIVDDAIVVVENIYRHAQEGEPIREAIVNGTSEVMLPVVSATTTTVAAFLPMLIMTGSTGEFFALIPKAVSFAIAASLIECLFILPLHYLDWGPKADTDGKAPHEKDNAFMRVARRFTEWGMGLTMRYKKLSLLAVLLAFAGAVFVLGVSMSGRMPLIKIRFFPEEYNEYYAIVEGPSSTPIEKTEAVIGDISDFILADGEGYAKTTTGFAGFFINEDYQNVFGNNLGIVIVTMPPKEEWDFQDPKAHLEEMRRRLEERYEKDGYDISVRAEETGPPSGKDVNVRVLGQNIDSVYALSDELMRYMREDLGGYLADLKDDSGQPNRVLRFKVRQDRAQEYGFDQAAVASLAASVLDGRYVGKYRVSDEELDLKMILAPSSLNRPRDALSLPLLEHPSGPVRLGDLVEIETRLEPGQLNRYNTERAVTLSANIKAGAQTSTTEIVNKIRKHFASVRSDFPGAGIDFGGEFESTRRSFTSLAYAFGVAILLIYLILATQFGSYVQPAIILSAVVFSLIGVVFGKLVSQSLFTVNSFIAVVGVTGVVVNDSLVLLDFINRAYKRGKDRAEAVKEGIRLRLRPILLTTLTTSLGLLPMALGIPSYSVTWGTMASTFVTGLATATALTLFIVPIEWDMLMRFTEWKQARKERKELKRTEKAEA